MCGSSVLFENAARTVVVVDIPRSIEEAQHNSSEGTSPKRRLFSSQPPTEPFPARPEPRAATTTSHSRGSELAAQLADLTAQAAVETALDELQQTGISRYHLPRLCLPTPDGAGEEEATDDNKKHHSQEREEAQGIYVPKGARYLPGTVAACRGRFLAEAPQFDVVVLDPPWPNRSARRRRRGREAAAAAAEGGGRLSTDKGYSTATDMDAARELLEAIPVGAKLGGSGSLVAVWVTNKAACTALLTDPRTGLFRAWGVEHVATWTWLKVTTAGEPVLPVTSQWRKPWERLLIGRRRQRPAVGGQSSSRAGAASGPALLPPLPPERVIVAVPDVHSRKPHLGLLLAPFLPARKEAVGLEVFARNLTAGWWAWGDEVLLFQQKAWWEETAPEPRRDAIDR